MFSVLKELEQLIPPLSQDEFDGLRENIVREGAVREPLSVFTTPDGEDVLIDGHNRWRIIQELGLPYTTQKVQDVRTLDEAKLWMLKNQFGKRNLSREERMALAIQYKPLFMEMGKERQRTNIKQGEGKQVLMPTHKHDTLAEMARVAGVGKETMRQFAEVKEKAPDLCEQVVQGKITVHSANKEVRQRAGKSRRLELNNVTQDLAAQIADSEPEESPAHDVQVGQWWRLGNHYLYVGDSSSPAFYESEFCKMKNGFDFAFADPPYGADVAEWDKEFVWNHDYLSDIAKVVAVTPGHWAMHKFHKATNMPYKWQIACWVKNGMSRGGVGLANYNTIVLFSKGSVHRKEQDFWQVFEDNSPVIETTVKPVQDAYDVPFKGRKNLDVMMRLLDMFVPQNGTVVDAFGGSGTTLFAAEKQGKTCVMAEILPTHALEIIRRFEKLFPKWKKATLLN